MSDWMARDLEIRATVKELEAAWRADPEQRLGQLIANVGRTQPGAVDINTIWNLRDVQWRELLRATWAGGKR